MKIPQLAGVIVTSMVVILVVVSVLMPIIQESDTTSYITSQNENYAYKMAMGDGTFSQTVTLSAITESSATITIGTASTTLTGEDSILWLWDNGIAMAYSGGISFMAANVGAGSMRLVDANDTLTFSAGTVTATHNPGTDSEGSRTSPYTWTLYKSDAGSWGAFTGTFNVSNATEFYSVFAGNQNYYLVGGQGTATSMSQAIGHTSESSTWTANYTAKGTYYQVTSCDVSLTTTVNPGTYTGTAVASIAPLEYVSGTEDGGIVNTLLGIVPVLIIVGVVMAVVGVYFKGRDY